MIPLKKKKPLEPLRNCAFCGGTPRLARCGDQKEFWIYQCTNCYESSVRWWEARVSPSAARKIWQKRTEEAEHVLQTYRWVKKVEIMKAALVEEENRR